MQIRNVQGWNKGQVQHLGDVVGAETVPTGCWTIHLKQGLDIEEEREE